MQNFAFQAHNYHYKRGRRPFIWQIGNFVLWFVDDFIGSWVENFGKADLLSGRMVRYIK